MITNHTQNLLIQTKIILQNFLPETFLLICIFFLIFYKLFIKERFSPVYCIVFLLYSIICLLITIYLVTQAGAFDNHLFLINYKICFIKIIILSISTICLILFRYSLTKSETNCLGYFIFYLFTTFICMLAISIKVTHLYFLFIFLELLTICFYLLSSFNYNNYGYLLFRFIHKRKLLYLSSLFGFLGLIFFESHSYIWSLFLGKQLQSYNYFSMLLNYNKYILLIGTICLILSLLLKLTVYHSPTHYIYYQKTPLITIIYMHLIPKIIFFYFISELLFTNYYFSTFKCHFTLLLTIVGLCCLVISIGMRRLFLKHCLEYLSLVNTGYLLLCITPLTFKSLNYSVYFFFYYILIILFYGGIVMFFDNEQYPGKRISFDTILSNIEDKDYLSVTLLTLFSFFFGLPPTRRDYPCSRGVPFNGFFLQGLLLTSLVVGGFYLILILLIFFNYILFFFYVATIIPFWFEQKTPKFILFFEYLNSSPIYLYLFPKYLNLFPEYLNVFLVEFISFYLIILTLILQVDNTLITNFIQTFHI